MKRILALLGIAIVPVIIITLVLFRGRLREGMGVKYLPVKKVEKAVADKSDPKWLENYCFKEVKNLPEAPFKYTNKDVREFASSSVSDVYLHKFVPEDKWYKAYTCKIWYKFEPEEAYASVGVDYVIHIDSVNTFQENTDRLYSEAIDKSWKKISPLSDSEGGRPHYSYDGFPLVFTRENADIGTMEYATIEFGSNSLYVHLSVYEK
ncbi:hypothetical protein HY419_01250 [candidate division WWE3 bacterium]|nr:hypothetical protein [candidate division WWE3 bacterium]